MDRGYRGTAAWALATRARWVLWRSNSRAPESSNSQSAAHNYTSPRGHLYKRRASLCTSSRPLAVKRMDFLGSEGHCAGVPSLYPTTEIPHFTGAVALFDRDEIGGVGGHSPAVAPLFPTMGETHPESLICNSDSKNQKVQAPMGGARKSRRPLNPRGRIWTSASFWGPVLAAVIEQKIPRLDSGLQKITWIENNLFSYRLDYSTPRALRILGNPNDLGQNSNVTAQSRKSSRTLTQSSSPRIKMKLQ